MITKFSKEIFTNSQFLPVGAVVDFTRPTPPEGFLNCNGAAVSRVTYSKLFDVIGTTYGAGDGSTTFNLPDFRGRFAEGGQNVGERKVSGLPKITGAISTSGTCLFKDQATSVAGAFARKVSKLATLTIADKGALYDNEIYGVTFDATRCSEVYGRSDTVQPASIVVNKCIKY